MSVVVGLWSLVSGLYISSTSRISAGKKIAVVTAQADAASPSQAIPNPESRIPDPGPVPEKKRDLKAEAMSSSTVQAMLDVFPAEIRDVEEM